MKLPAANGQVLRDEALRLQDEVCIRAASGCTELGFNSFVRRGWKRFCVKRYDPPLPSARALWPRSVAFVASIPSANAAMFAVLPPGGDPGRHRDRFEQTAIRASRTENIDGDPIGPLNRIVSVAYSLRLPAKALKKWNRRVDYAVKWGPLAALRYLLFWPA